MLLGEMTSVKNDDWTRTVECCSNNKKGGPDSGPPSRAIDETRLRRGVGSRVRGSTRLATRIAQRANRSTTDRTDGRATGHVGRADGDRAGAAIAEPCSVKVDAELASERTRARHGDDDPVLRRADDSRMQRGIRRT